MRIILAVLAMLACPAAIAQSLKERVENDEVVYADHDAAAMKAAFAKAGSSLPGFLAKLDKPPAGTDSYGVKLRFSDGDKDEYCWVNDIQKLGGDRYRGTLANTPRIVRNVRNGQRYDFSLSQIVDWVYVDNNTGRMHGNFTACVLLDKEAPAEREAMLSQLGLVCE